MGWLLTLWLSLPLVESDVEVKMWFSRERYCNFAKEKFSENPMEHILGNGRRAVAHIRDSQCRELLKTEAHLIPEHMRD